MMTIAICATIFAGLGAFMFRELRNAPEGFQDDDGFQYTWRNNSEETRDVSCVWVSGGADCDLISQTA